MAEVKRGYRKLTVILPVKEFDLLTRVADENDREVGQQAAFLLKQIMHRDLAKEYLDKAMENGEINTEVIYERPDEVVAGTIE